jgi:predicted TIM-barrel fold metal-dependent hydrolase
MPVQDTMLKPETLNTDRSTPFVYISEPEPRPVLVPVISVDDHLVEPPTVFEGRLPTGMVDQGPHMVTDDEGVPYWAIEDARLPVRMLDVAIAHPWTELKRAGAPMKFDEMRRGMWDVHARVRDMDLGGIWASLPFPSTLWGFTGTVFSNMTDRELGRASLRAYNSWLLEEWCGAYPDRFIPCQVPWLNEAEIAAEEIRRNAEAGFKAVTFSESPEGLGRPAVYTDYWDPFLRACEETGTVVNLHVGSSGQRVKSCPSSATEVSTALFPVHALMAALDWVYARIPIRFPELKICMSEGGVSWVPLAVERLRRVHRTVDASKTWNRHDPHPADLLLEHFWFASIEDPSAYKLLDEIPVDHIVVETDYPHPDSSWPDNQAMLATQVAALPDETIRKIAYKNAANLYRHPEPPADRLRASNLGEERA